VNSRAVKFCTLMVAGPFKNSEESKLNGLIARPGGGLLKRPNAVSRSPLPPV